MEYYGRFIFLLIFSPTYKKYQIPLNKDLKNTNGELILPSYSSFLSNPGNLSSPREPARCFQVGTVDIFRPASTPGRRELSPRPTQIPFSNSRHFLALAMPGYCIPALQTYDIDPAKGPRRIQSASRWEGALGNYGDVTRFGWFHAAWSLEELLQESRTTDFWKGMRGEGEANYLTHII